MANQMRTKRKQRRTKGTKVKSSPKRTKGYQKETKEAQRISMKKFFTWMTYCVVWPGTGRYLLLYQPQHIMIYRDIRLHPVFEEMGSWRVMEQGVACSLKWTITWAIISYWIVLCKTINVSYQIILIVGHIKVGDESRQEGDVGRPVLTCWSARWAWLILRGWAKCRYSRSRRPAGWGPRQDTGAGSQPRPRQSPWHSCLGTTTKILIVEFCMKPSL